MIKTNVLKNQKEQKMRKMHMRSILSEVKNKSIIEELEREGFNFIIYLQSLMQDNFSSSSKLSSENRHHRSNQNKKEPPSPAEYLNKKILHNEKTKTTERHKGKRSREKANNHFIENAC